MNIEEVRICPSCGKEVEVEFGHKFPIYMCKKCNCVMMKITRKVK